jgi:RNA polymerase sigma factor for flagellar operon FliA
MERRRTNNVAAFARFRGEVTMQRREAAQNGLECAARAPHTGGLDLERERLMMEHLPLVRLIARRIHARLPQHVPIEDLFSAGVVGLIEAFSKFDPTKQIQFRSYAQFRIRGAILDSLRAIDWSPRELRRKAREIEQATQTLTVQLGRIPDEAEVAAALKLELSVYQRLLGELNGLEFVNLHPQGSEESEEQDLAGVPSRPADDPLFRCLQGEMQQLLAKAVDDLPERERRIVTLRYYEEMNMGEIGLALGMVKSAVSRIHGSAVVHLRTRLAVVKPVEIFPVNGGI